MHQPITKPSKPPKASKPISWGEGLPSPTPSPSSCGERFFPQNSTSNAKALTHVSNHTFLKLCFLLKRRAQLCKTTSSTFDQHFHFRIILHFWMRCFQFVVFLEWRFRLNLVTFITGGARRWLSNCVYLLLHLFQLFRDEQSQWNARKSASKVITRKKSCNRNC